MSNIDNVTEHFSATVSIHPSLASNSTDVNAFTEYARVRNSCCNSYKDDTDMGTLLNTYSSEAAARGGKQVLEDTLTGDAAALLEAGMRCVFTTQSIGCPVDRNCRLWTGCTLPKDKDRAMSMWMQIVLDKSLSRRPVPKRLHVRAVACLANSQWELRQTPEDGPDVWNIDSVYRAAVYADECASLGYIPPIVLFIGKKVRELQAVPNIAEARHPRFTKLANLWEVHDRRTQEVLREKERRDEKIAKTPLAYICAAEGCGIEGTKKSALLRCAGKCPMDIKPAYCSKECQRSVSTETCYFSAVRVVCSCKTSRIGKDTNHCASLPVHHGLEKSPLFRNLR